MFGIGAQEMVVIGLLFLIVFGPGKLPTMARDFGRFVGEARRSIEDFKEDLASQEEDDREPRDGQALQTSREPEQSGSQEEGAAVGRAGARSTPPTE